MQVKQSLRLNDDGLWARFELNGKHFSVNLDNMRPARWFAAEFRAQVAAEKALEAISGPTIAELIEQGHLAPYKIENFPGLQATPWSGEGLPPVGCECEVLWDSHRAKYESGKVLAHDEDRAVFRYTSGESKGKYDNETQRHLGVNNLAMFRPLRTAEQLAAEARAAEIDRLCKVVMAHPSYHDHNRNIDCSAAMRLAVEAIVDNKAFDA